MPPEFPDYAQIDPLRFEPFRIPRGEMECQMVRNGMQCRNATTEGITYPTPSGDYEILPVCVQCKTNYRIAALRKHRRRQEKPE